MSIIKRTKDHLIRLFFGNSIVPRGLFELNQYFRLYGPIHFDHKKGENKRTVAISTNFQYGSIVTSGENEKQLEENIKDAILTSFSVPSSYAKEARLYKEGSKEESYALGLVSCLAK